MSFLKVEHFDNVKRFVFLYKDKREKETKKQGNMDRLIDR